MNKVRAGNMLNKIIDSDAPFLARVAVWIGYYPLMYALAEQLDRFERSIRQQCEDVAAADGKKD